MPREKGFLPFVDGRLVENVKANLANHESRTRRNTLISYLRTKNDHRQLILQARVELALRRHIAEALDPRSPLEGHVVAVKDNIWTNDLPTTCASNVLKGFQSPNNAGVVGRLKEQGVLVTAKTNMDEFGMGSHSTHSFAGPVINGIVEHNELSAGGSSGGSAVAVMTGHCHLALGTDTGGSVRLPAAYTGLVGFKPSYGMLSRFGVVPYANSLDTVGIIARNCLDAHLAFRLLNGHDARDPTSLSGKTRSRIQLMKTLRSRGQDRQTPVRLVRLTSPSRVARSPLAPRERAREYPGIESKVGRSRRIGVPAEYNIEELSDTVRAAWVRMLSHLELLGHTIVPISLPATKYALSAYYVLAPAEASSNLAKYDGVRYGQRSPEETDDADGRLYAETRGMGFGDEVKRRILLGAFTLSADAVDNYFIQAQRVRRLVQRDFDQAFRMANPLHNNSEANTAGRTGVDFIVCPTAPTPPPMLSSLKHSDPVATYMNDVFTVPASLAGLPVVSVPAPPRGLHPDSDDELIGMQIVGQYGDDHAVLQFARTEAEMFSDWSSLRLSQRNQPGRIR